MEAKSGEKKDVNFSTNSHPINLNTIGNVRVTDREIDVIACIIAGRSSKKIAFILSISHKTVEIHVRNIMVKVGCNSRDQLIDFIEKSDKFSEYKEHYTTLLIKSVFARELKKIAVLVKEQSINRSCIVFYLEQQVKNVLAEDVESYLQAAGLKITSKAWKLGKPITFFLDKLDIQQTDHVIYILPSSFTQYPELTEGLTEEISRLQSLIRSNSHSVIIITLDENIKLLSGELSGITYLGLEQYKDLYLLTFELLQKLLPDGCIDRNIAEFKEKYKQPIADPFALEVVPKEKELVKNKVSKNTTYNISKKAIIVGVLCFFVGIIVANIPQGMQLFIKLKQKNEQTPLYNTQLINNTEQTSNQSTTPMSVEQIKEWNLPAYVEYYIPRDNITSAIWKKFNLAEKRETVFLVGLKGLGGVGKTFLAINAIRNPKQNYKFKGWFRADTQELLKVDYFELGEKLHLFAQNLPDKLKINLVKNWLTNKRDVLLVYDNAPNIETLQYYLPDNGHIIITSRNYKLPEAIDIDVMTEIEALKLLNKLIPQKLQEVSNYKEQAKRLIKKLGYLPLAISQAGYYIHENMLKIPDYLALYEANRKKLLTEDSLPPRDKHEPVYITWDLNIETIKKLPQGDKAIDLLNFIACCDYENIPKELLMQYLYGNTTRETEILFNKILLLLRQYSLVNVFPNAISMHNLVHQWIHDKYLQENKVSILQRGKAAIEEMYLVESKTPNGIEFVKYLIPHAEAVLSKIKPMIADVKLIDLMLILGDSYKTMGDFNKSKEFYNQALVASEKHVGASNIKIAKILSKLGEIYYHLGDNTKAKQLFEKALTVIENHYGSNHIETAGALNKISWIFLQSNDYIKYKKIFEESLKIINQYHNSNYKDIIKLLPQFTPTKLSSNEYLKVKQILEKALIITESYYGYSHPETIYTLRNLCWLYMIMGDQIKVKQISEQILAIIKNCRGSEQIEIAPILQSLGCVHLQLYNYTQVKKSLEKATQFLEKALIIIENYYGTDHIMAFEPLVDLGWIYLSSGNYVKAKQSSERALAIVNKCYGRYNIKSIYALHVLGWIAICLNNHEEAKRFLERGLTTIEGSADLALE